MKISWWKILGICIVLYVLIAGFLIPLKPGVASVHPIKITPGEASSFTIQLYNTFLEKATNNNAWLKLDDTRLVKATELEVISENLLKAKFYLSPTVYQDLNKNKEVTLVVSNEKDGYALYPGGIKVLEPKDQSENQNMVISGLDEIPQIEDTKFPYRSILYETIRNTFFHVAIWFAMFILLITSCYHSIRYLRTADKDSDLKSEAMISVALYFGVAGIITGSMWARYTWGTFWTTDIKLNMSALSMLVYFAYWILRSSINDPDTKARISAVYNLFAFVCLMVLVMVIPRFTDSLHPGNGGNPALGGEDLDNTLRLVFYPAIIGYTIIGFWIAQIYYRMLRLKDKLFFL